MPEDKPKVAFYWCASCGGCEESVVDLAEDILAVTDAVDIVFWPVALDFKRKHVEAMDKGAITVTFINGAVRTSEQEEMVRLLRDKSQVVIAYGACAHLGGIPSLANQFDREQVLQFVYHDSPSTSNPDGVRPVTSWTDAAGRTVELPEFRNLARSLDQVIDVDYTLPGCAPSPKLLKQAVMALLEGNLPPKGTVLAPDVALCHECPRKESKSEEIAYTKFYRPHQIAIDPEVCLLEQGVVCMGPATRAGCEAACINGNMPCTGCYGPTSRVTDQGAKMLSHLAGGIDAEDEATIQSILDGIPDPIGTLYRYGLARSILRRRVDLA
jgi:F420-non-reducing hydrogenase small subunit